MFVESCSLNKDAAYADGQECASDEIYDGSISIGVNLVSSSFNPQ